MCCFCSETSQPANTKLASTGGEGSRLRGKPPEWRDPAEGERVPSLDHSNGTSEKPVEALWLVQWVAEAAVLTDIFAWLLGLLGLAQPHCGSGVAGSRDCRL